VVSGKVLIEAWPKQARKSVSPRPSADADGNFRYRRQRIAGILLHQTGVDCAPALKLGPT
jgi:hypothetical protein